MAASAMASMPLPEEGDHDSWISLADQDDLAQACRMQKWQFVCEALLEAPPASINRRDHNQCGTALHWAACHGHVPTVRLLLDGGAYLEEPNWAGLQAVHIAAVFGRLSVLIELSGHDYAVICAETCHRQTPAHFAAHADRIEILEWLYLRGAPMSAVDDCGRTPLHCAMSEGHVLATQLILNHGVDVGARDHLGCTALHAAAQQGHVDVFRTLARNNPSSIQQFCRNTNGQGQTPRQVAKCFKLRLQACLIAMELWFLLFARKSKLSGRGHSPTNYPGAKLWLIALPCYRVLRYYMLFALSTQVILMTIPLALGHIFLVIFQLLSFSHWFSACRLDPGYVSPTQRLGAQRDGPDGHEGLLTGLQVDLRMLSQDPKINEADCLATGEVFSPVKRRFEDSLRQAAVSRQACYPDTYLALVTPDFEGWGRKACTICGVVRAHHSKHCRTCGRCVEHFDHHCPALGNCVGWNNAKYFKMFLVWTFAALVGALWMSWDISCLISVPQIQRNHRLYTSSMLLAGGDIALTLFTGLLLFDQIYFAMLDITSYEAFFKGKAYRTELLRKLSWKTLFGNLSSNIGWTGLALDRHRPISKI